jgi:hypothetical protein
MIGLLLLIRPEWVGLESDGGDQFVCGGGRSGKVRTVRRPRQGSAPGSGSESPVDSTLAGSAPAESNRISDAEGNPPGIIAERFSYPRAKPLSFSACLAENPDALKLEIRTCASRVDLSRA